MQKTTYCQLLDRSLALARSLVQLGFSQSVMAVTIPEGIELAIAQLGVLISRNIFLPVDKNDPRYHSMVKDCCPSLFIDVSVLNDLVETGMSSKIKLTYPQEEDNCHIFYTSGSTGGPKGVLVTHGSLHSFVQSKVGHSLLSNTSKLFLASAFTFDPNIGDTMSALFAGAVLCSADRKLIIGGQLTSLLQQMKVTHACMTPTLWSMRGSNRNDISVECPCLVELSLGGERMPKHVRDHWDRKVRLVNTYGVTEATVYQAAYCVGGDDLIGDPYPGVELGLMFENSKIQWIPNPDKLWIGQTGEIIIAGKQLAVGYVNRPALTAERFIFVDGKRLYKTGDLGCLVARSPNCIKFLGRCDRQIKIRGVRVELQEIEDVLLSCDFLVKRCTAIQRNNSIVAFINYETLVVPRCLEMALIYYCSQNLPVYMTPSRIIGLTDSCISSNGKLKDLSAMELPPQDVLSSNETMTDVEKLVAGVWSKRLGVDESRIGPWDSFSQLGGDSLDAQAISQELIKFLSYSVPETSDAYEQIQTMLHESNTYGELSGDIKPSTILESKSLREYVNVLYNTFAKLDLQVVQKQQVASEDFLLKNALFAAASSGRADATTLLVDPKFIGYSPNGGVSRKNPGRSPLHVAVVNGHVKVVETLLKHGAHCFATDKILPSHLAASSTHANAVPVLECLIQSMRSKDVKNPVHVRDGRKQNLIHSAARGGNPIVLSYVLEELKRHVHNEKEQLRIINCIDRWHRAPLHWAVVNGNEACVSLLMDAGADSSNHIPLRITKSSTRLPFDTALQLAIRTHQSQNIINLLQQK